MICVLCFILAIPRIPFSTLLYYFLEIFRFLTTIPLLNDESLIFYRIRTLPRFALRFS